MRKAAGSEGDPEVKELSEWLEADDSRSRDQRTHRLRELLELLPMPGEGLTSWGGDESTICLEELRLCYVQGSSFAVVLLCLAYVERELAATLYGAGWEGAKKATLTGLLEKAQEDGLLSSAEQRTFRDLADVRNSYAHFRNPSSETSLLRQAVEGNAPATEVISGEAKRAIRALAGLVKRQSGMRLGLSPRNE